MKVVFSEQQLDHAPASMLSSGTPVVHPESPARAHCLLDAATQAGLTLEAPVECAGSAIAAVHSRRYLDYLENIFTRWSRIPGGADEVMPGIQARDRRDGTGAPPGYPKSAAGQAGFHHFDLSCPINEHTWQSAYWSAQSAAHAAEDVLSGNPACYALGRPPGHHAGREYAAGFCYLANSAIAVETLKARFDRVAVLDVDVHHGNGTQDIFYARDDVLTVSIHAHPERYFPFFWGYADERGAAGGEGYNINIPLPRGTGDEQYLSELLPALDAIERFDPGALVIALGLDAHESDPFQGFAITTSGFAEIARPIGALKLPTVLVQEGGYLSPPLGDNLRAFLDGFRAGHGN